MKIWIYTLMFALGIFCAGCSRQPEPEKIEMKIEESELTPVQAPHRTIESRFHEYGPVVDAGPMRVPRMAPGGTVQAVPVIRPRVAGPRLTIERMPAVVGPIIIVPGRTVDAVDGNGPRILAPGEEYEPPPLRELPPVEAVVSGDWAHPAGPPIQVEGLPEPQVILHPRPADGAVAVSPSGTYDFPYRPSGFKPYQVAMIDGDTTHAGIAADQGRLYVDGSGEILVYQARPDGRIEIESRIPTGRDDVAARLLARQGALYRLTDNREEIVCEESARDVPARAGAPASCTTEYWTFLNGWNVISPWNAPSLGEAAVPKRNRGNSSDNTPFVVDGRTVVFVADRNVTGGHDLYFADRDRLNTHYGLSLDQEQLIYWDRSNQLLLAVNQNDLNIHEITYSAGSPRIRLLSTITVPANGSRFLPQMSAAFMRGKVAYLLLSGGSDGTLVCVDLRQPRNPEIMAEMKVPFRRPLMAAQDNTIVIADRVLIIFEIPENNIPVATYMGPLEFAARSIALDRNLLFIRIARRGVQVLRINP
ncbi:MAG TPA: hypothetical protein VM658_21375 [bacterium]|nr:hypothetical protein [bacterium]